LKQHARYYEIAGLTVSVESDLPFTDTTFHTKFRCFEVNGPGEDTVTLRHHFGLPDPIPEMAEHRQPKEVYRKPPWAIYRSGDSWVYLGIATEPDDLTLYKVAVFSLDHTAVDIYNDPGYEMAWRHGELTALTLFPSDQILIARLLADRAACYLHSGALTIDGQGFVFVGHSEAGKSTTMQLVRSVLGDRTEILCDDRNIVRRWPEGFRVHGTWSHGDIPEVSSASAPVRAILFLEQHRLNEIIALTDRKIIWERLLATLIKPLVTAEWWNKEMDLLETLVDEVPFYTMRFDKSGAVVPLLEPLVT